MNKWTRIGDDQFAPFGARELCFIFSKGTYTVSVNQSDQNYVTVAHNGKNELWAIDLKEQCGERFKLSGPADWIPELMNDHCWYELILDESAKITYWGDCVVYRVDHELK